MAQAEKAGDRRASERPHFPCRDRTVRLSLCPASLQHFTRWNARSKREDSGSERMIDTTGASHRGNASFFCRIGSLSPRGREREELFFLPDTIVDDDDRRQEVRARPGPRNPRRSREAEPERFPKMCRPCNRSVI